MVERQNVFVHLFLNHLAFCNHSQEYDIFESENQNIEKQLFGDAL